MKTKLMMTVAVLAAVFGMNLSYAGTIENCSLDCETSAEENCSKLTQTEYLLCYSASFWGCMAGCTVGSDASASRCQNAGDSK